MLNKTNKLLKHQDGRENYVVEILQNKILGPKHTHLRQVDKSRSGKQWALATRGSQITEPLVSIRYKAPHMLQNIFHEYDNNSFKEYHTYKGFIIVVFYHYFDKIDGFNSPPVIIGIKRMTRNKIKIIAGETYKEVVRKINDIDTINFSNFKYEPYNLKKERHEEILFYVNDHNIIKGIDYFLFMPKRFFVHEVLEVVGSEIKYYEFSGSKLSPEFANTRRFIEINDKAYALQSGHFREIINPLDNDHHIESCQYNGIQYEYMRCYGDKIVFQTSVDINNASKKIGVVILEENFKKRGMQLIASKLKEKKENKIEESKNKTA